MFFSLFYILQCRPTSMKKKLGEFDFFDIKNQKFYFINKYIFTPQIREQMSGPEIS